MDHSRDLGDAIEECLDPDNQYSPPISTCYIMRTGVPEGLGVSWVLEIEGTSTYKEKEGSWANWQVP